MRVGILLATCLLPLIQSTDGFAQNASLASLSTLQHETSSLKVTFNARQPGVSALSLDSLQRGRFSANPIIDVGMPPIQYTVSARGGWIRDAYMVTFFDQSAGVLAGWRNSDGQLHNYYFPFVNGIAVRLLESFSRQGFSGRAPKGLTYD